MNFTMNPIGIIQSCFKSKFGIPRQAGLSPSARATLELLPPYNRPEAVRGLEAFSHLWLLFVFHDHLGQTWRPTVRPPRLGGNQRLGVFATRSPFRPNPLGLSAVVLEGVDCGAGGVVLHLGGTDLLDGTPVLDIKPYLPYADARPDARSGFAPEAPAEQLRVHFPETVELACRHWENQGYPELRELIREIVRLDPRPAYLPRNLQRDQFGTRLLDFEVRWQVAGAEATITEVLFLHQTPLPLP